MLSHVLTLCDPIDCSLPVSSYLELFTQEHWSGVPFPTPYYLLSKDYCLSTFLKVTNTHTHTHTHRTLETKQEKIQLNNRLKILTDISLKIANNHMKRCSTSYVIREIPIKTRYHYNSKWMAPNQNADNTRWWRGYVTAETLSTGGTANGTATLEDWQFLTKLNIL